MVASATLHPGAARAQDKTAVKAALIFNILRFTSFPADRTVIRLCALANDPVAGDLRRLDGRMAGGRKLDVVVVSGAGSLGSSCDVIYLDDAPARSVGGAGRGQIVIGSARNFAENGGTVGLINFGGQIRFTVNAGAARNSTVTFSAQLMQLAAKVIS